MSEGPSRPRGGSKTAKHTAPRRGLGPLLPSRSQPLRRPPTRHVPASPAPHDLLPLAWPILRLVPSTSLVQPAREWHDAVYLRALPRQRPRRAESASTWVTPLRSPVNGRLTDGLAGDVTRGAARTVHPGSPSWVVHDGRAALPATTSVGRPATVNRKRYMPPAHCP
jgi:hypothetical protein